MNDYALSVCSYCKSIIIIGKNTFYQTFRTSNEKRTNSSTTSSGEGSSRSLSRRISCTINLAVCCKKWEYEEDLNQLLLLIQKINCSFFVFPLCNTCSINLCGKIGIQTNIFYALSKHFISIENKKSSLKLIKNKEKHAHRELDQIKTEYSRILTTNTFHTNSSNFQQNQELFQIIEEARFQPSSPMQDVKLICEAKMKTQFVEPKSSFFSFSICFFPITSSFHYGVICNHRLGFFPYNQNSITECNIALTFLFMLVQHFLRIFSINSTEFTSSIPMLKDSQGVLYSLQIPINLKPRSIFLFNKALQLFMKATARMFWSRDFFSANGIQVFLLDPKEKKIGSNSYFFDINNLEEWSYSMKQLLFNLKMLQSCLLFQAIKNCN